MKIVWHIQNMAKSSGLMVEIKISELWRGEQTRGGKEKTVCTLESSFSVYFCKQKDDLEAIPGYLSLHQSADSLTLKWTPNQLMNGTLGDSELEKR